MGGHIPTNMATFHGNQNVGGVPSAIYREVGQHFTISVEFMVCVYYIYIQYICGMELSMGVLYGF